MFTYKKPELGAKRLLLLKLFEPGKLIKDFKKDILDDYFTQSNFAAYAKFCFSSGNTHLLHDSTNSKENATYEPGLHQTEGTNDETETERRQQSALYR